MAGDSQGVAPVRQFALRSKIPGSSATHELPAKLDGLTQLSASICSPLLLDSAPGVAAVWPSQNRRSRIREQRCSPPTRNLTRNWEKLQTTCPLSQHAAAADQRRVPDQAQRAQRNRLPSARLRSRIHPNKNAKSRRQQFGANVKLSRLPAGSR